MSSAHAVDFVVHTRNGCSRLYSFVLHFVCFAMLTGFKFSYWIYVFISTTAEAQQRESHHSHSTISEIECCTSLYGHNTWSCSSFASVFLLQFYFFLCLYFPNLFCIRPNGIVTWSIFICYFVYKFQYRIFRKFRQIIMPFAAIHAMVVFNRCLCLNFWIALFSHPFCVGVVVFGK